MAVATCETCGAPVVKPGCPGFTGQFCGVHLPDCSRVPAPLEEAVLQGVKGALGFQHDYYFTNGTEKTVVVLLQDDPEALVALYGAKLQAQTSDITGLGVQAQVCGREGKRAPQLLVLGPGEEKQRRMTTATIEVSAGFQHSSQSFGIFKKLELMDAGGRLNFLDHHLNQQTMVQAVSFHRAVKVLCAQDEASD